jgi:hypothetical protein
MAAPYRPAATAKYLAQLARETRAGVRFSSPDAKMLFRSIYVDCSIIGLDNRYVFYDTIFRKTLLLIRAFAADPKAYLAVKSSPTGIIVDAITPPNKTNPNTLKVRLAVIDRNGRFLQSSFTEDGIGGACRGVQGDIFVDSKALAAGPPE